MTRNDILNKADAEKKVELIFDKWNYCCREDLAKSNEEQLKIWRELCRTRFRDSCLKCKAEFLNEEVKANENIDS